MKIGKYSKELQLTKMDQYAIDTWDRLKAYMEEENRLYLVGWSTQSVLVYLDYICISHHKILIPLICHG